MRTWLITTILPHTHTLMDEHIHAGLQFSLRGTAVVLKHRTHEPHSDLVSK